MSLFSGYNRKGNGSSADSLGIVSYRSISIIAATTEVSNYSLFLKHYRDEFNTVIGKLNDCPDYSFIHSVSNAVLKNNSIEIIFQCNIS